jgi:hypothetical protein
MIAKAVQADVVRAEVFVVLTRCPVVTGNRDAYAALALSHGARVGVLFVARCAFIGGRMVADAGGIAEVVGACVAVVGARHARRGIVVALAAFAIVGRALVLIVAVDRGVRA